MTAATAWALWAARWLFYWMIVSVVVVAAWAFLFWPTPEEDFEWTDGEGE